MFSFPKSRPSASLVVSGVALFSALGGTGYAASAISGKSIKTHSVPGNRIVDNALTGAQINESLLGQVPQAVAAQTAKLADDATHAKAADTATTAKTADSATTAKTADDSKLLEGRPAAAFMANAVRVRFGNGPTAGGGGIPSSATANCAADEKGIGGGGGWYIPGFDTPTELEAPVTASVPKLNGPDITGWEIHGRNLSGSDRYMRAYVICVPKTA